MEDKSNTGDSVSSHFQTPQFHQKYFASIRISMFVKVIKHCLSCSNRLHEYNCKEPIQMPRAVKGTRLNSIHRTSKNTTAVKFGEKKLNCAR